MLIIPGLLYPLPAASSQDGQISRIKGKWSNQYIVAYLDPITTPEHQRNQAEMAQNSDINQNRLYIPSSKQTALKNDPSADLTPKKPANPGNCIQTLKNAGVLPNKRVTKDGFARTIPTKLIHLYPGLERVVKTNESATGHVLKIRVNDQGQAVSIVEGGHPQGVGRIVDPAKIVGEVAL